MSRPVCSVTYTMYYASAYHMYPKSCNYIICCVLSCFVNVSLVTCCVFSCCVNRLSVACMCVCGDITVIHIIIILIIIIIIIIIIL